MIIVVLLWLGLLVYIATTKQNVLQIHLVLVWALLFASVLYALGRLLTSLV